MKDSETRILDLLSGWRDFLDEESKNNSQVESDPILESALEELYQATPQKGMSQNLIINEIVQLLRNGAPTADHYCKGCSRFVGPSIWEHSKGITIKCRFCPKG